MIRPPGMWNAAISFAQLMQMRAFFKSCAQYSATAKQQNGRAFAGTILRCLADGTEVNASGTNSFPGNFLTFSQEIRKLITTERINSVRFTDGTYEVILPESWVGTVTASFSESHVAFYVDKTVFQIAIAFSETLFAYEAIE